MTIQGLELVKTSAQAARGHLRGEARGATVRLIIAAAAAAAMLAGQARAQSGYPPAQEALITTMSNYNQRYDGAPNPAQQAKVRAAFDLAFCSTIPKRPVSNWVGSVELLDAHNDLDAIELDVQIDPRHELVTGSLGIGLLIGNGETLAVNGDVLAPHAQTLITQDSPLYGAASNINEHDRIVFSGSFVPFKSMAACESTVDGASYFALFHFSDIRDVGADSGQ